MNIFSILVPKHMLTYLNAEDSLETGVEFLMASGYTAVPVVDDDGKYVGVVSEGDFLRAVMKYGREKLKNYKVRELVETDRDDYVLNTVGKEEIMEKILDRNFVSMIDDRRCFIGIITRRSVIMFLKDK